MDHEESLGGYYSSGQNMSPAGKVADSAGIAVIAATAVEMASESI